MKTSIPTAFAALLLMFIILAPALAQEGPDEVEPNDSREDATEISGYEIEGEVGRDGDDDDWFVLEGQEQKGHYAGFTIRYDDEVCDIDFEVYSDGDLIGTADARESPESIFCSIPDTCYIHVFAYEGHGEYTIEIEPIDLEECQGPDEVEPNHELEIADGIDRNLIEGYACPGDVDWFILDELDWPDSIFTLYYDETLCDIDLTVYNDDEMVGSLDSISSPDSDAFYVQGQCRIMVEAFEGEGEYRIEITTEGVPFRLDHSACAGPDEIEPNDCIRDGGVSYGLMIEGYACEDDVDWFVLDGQEGTSPYITLDYDEDECEISLEVLSDGADAGSLLGDDSPGGAEFDVPGGCMIIVRCLSGEGAYTIEIEP